jgi:CO/xanthine dehydrogenase FAD-binding subunit
MIQAAYVAPSSLEEALRFLDDTNHPSMPIAGGTQLLVDLRNDTSRAALLVDLRHLDMLKQIRLRTHSIEIGGLVTLAQVACEERILQYAPLLAEMAKYFGNPLIRAAATIGGNIASSHSQVTDAIVPLLALDAKLLLQSSKAEGYQQRTLGIDEYVHQNPQAGELISQITVPVMSSNTIIFYNKLGNRKAGAVPIASAAILIASQHQRIIDARITLGAIALTPLRAKRAETSLLGEILPLRESVINRCMDTLAEELPEPLHDIWASASYRIMMGKALVKKALRQAQPGNYEQVAKGEIDDR